MERISIPPQAPFPNSPWDVQVYPQAWAPEAVSEDAVSNCLTANGWTTPWVNGVYPFHHFHSNAHEILVILKGHVTVRLGGPEGDTYTLSQGDAVLLPAGVAHQRVSASPDYQIAGAYPNGQAPDLHKGDPDEFEALLDAVSNLEPWPVDPITGAPNISARSTTE